MKKLFMLCTLGFMGLQGADSGKRITTYPGKTVVEDVAPEYPQPPFQQPYSYPSAPIATQYQPAFPTAPAARILDLSQCTEEELQEALVNKITTRELLAAGITSIDPAKINTRQKTKFRSTGSLPIADQPDASAYTHGRLSHAGASDSNETVCESPQLSRPTHRRQRSFSETDALFAQAAPQTQEEVASLHRWHQPSSPLTPLIVSCNFDLTVLSQHSITAFNELLAAVHRVQSDAQKLLELRYRTLVSVEEIPDAPPKLQDAADEERKKERDKTRKAIIALCSIHKTLDALLVTKKSRKKIRLLFAKK